MYINLYAIIAGLVGTLFIVTKMRHPHIKHVRESLEGSFLFKVINALDFYTGNHALFYGVLFPESPSNFTPSRYPFPSPVPSICSCAQLSSPHVDSYSLPKKSWRGAYQILPALSATAGLFLFSVAIYLRKSLQHALRENQQNVVIHAIQVERRVSQSQKPNSVLPASNADAQQDALVPSSSVSVMTRRDDPIFYPNADPVIVAPSIPVAISNYQINSFPEPSPQSCQSSTPQSDSATPLATDSPPPPSTPPSATHAHVTQIDDDLPYSFPLPQDEPKLVTAKESSGISMEPSSTPKPDVTAISYFAFLPFAQHLDVRRSTIPTAAPSSGSSTRSPRNPPHITEPGTPSRSNSTPEAYSRLNSLLSNTVVGIETTSDSDATRIEAPVVSAADYKIKIPRVRATTSLAQPMTVSGSASHWEHPEASTSAPTEAHFVTGRTGADLVLAMSTSMPQVIDLEFMSGGGGHRVGASGSISPLAEVSASPRASSILRQVAAAAAADAADVPFGSSRRRSTMTAAVLQTPWLNRTGVHDSGGEAAPVPETRSTGAFPIQTAAQRNVMRRVLGLHRSSAGGERWTGPADSVERPMRITRVFGQPAA
ncbi:hypothetical protein H2248_009197 [Termitomyces sp. 'cryptogamus']|nr:hypothetical protein H2248_009197 [Termitomyces sp. 'cryptogamus']